MIKKYIAGVFIIVFLGFSLVLPSWISVHVDNRYFTNDDVINTVKKSQLYGDLIFIPKISYDLSKKGIIKSYNIYRDSFNGLQVFIEPHKIIAVLPAHKLLTSSGQIVEGDVDLNLPFYDVAEANALELERWRVRNAELLGKIPYKIKEISYDAVSKQIRLMFDNYMVLVLGSMNMSNSSLNKFLALLPYFAKHRFVLSRHLLDFRYPDGFAYSRI